MKISKWIALLVGVCIMAGTMTSCEGDHRTERKEQAARLLSEKYNEEITVLSYQGQQVFDDYYTVTAMSEKYPELVFEASVEVDGDGLSDNYAGKRIAAMISDRIARNLDDVQGYVYVFSELMVDMLPKEYAEMSVEEYAGIDRDNRITVNVCVTQEHFETDDLYTSLTGMFAGLPELTGIMNLYIVSEDTMGKIQDYLEENTRLYADFKDSFQKYRAISVPFDHGNPDLTPDGLAAALRN